MLENLEPKEVFTYFEQICQIPHGSGNTKAISDFLAGFARDHDLRYIQDEWNNVLIFKDATAGYEQAEPIIIQGHMDMVCEKESGCQIDFNTQGLELVVQGDEISANGTTLGGDDGIALAYGMAVLAADNLAHPALEVLFTTDEETGMDGAQNVDLSVLKGRRLLNLDSEEEGIILCGCAGGMRCDCTFHANASHADFAAFEKNELYTLVNLSVEGLKGGHSGSEIDKNRANSNILMGRLLYTLSGQITFGLAALEGGNKDNAIPRRTDALLTVKKTDLQLLTDICTETENIFKNEYAVTDPDVTVIIRNNTASDNDIIDIVSAEDAVRWYKYLMAVPNGVQGMSADIDGLVETSLNLGIMKLEKGCFTAKFSLRSSVESRINTLMQKLNVLTESFGGVCSTHSAYPGWAYKRESPLRQLLTDTYEQMYGCKPEIEVIHAGVECGLFLEKIPQLDCVSIGPDMLDIHTPDERLSISSTKRVWEFIIEVLKNARN